MKIRINDNLKAIFTYIQSYDYYIVYIDFVQWCIDYGYYKEFYQNFHIIRDLINEHNTTHTDIEPVREI